MRVQNKLVERRLIEQVWNRGDYAVVDELIAGDFLGHFPGHFHGYLCLPGDDRHGREGYRQFYVALRKALPDLEVTIEDQIAQGDKVATHWTARSKSAVRFQGVTIDRIADGKVVECWMSVNDVEHRPGRPRLLATVAMRHECDEK